MKAISVLIGLSMALVLVVMIPSNSSAVTTRYARSDATCYFLDPIGQAVEDAFHADTQYWNSTDPPHYVNWRTLVYPGANPSTSAAVHVYDTPTAGYYSISLTMNADNTTDPVADGWYTLEIWVNGKWGSGSNVTTVTALIEKDGVSCTDYYEWGYGSWAGGIYYPKNNADRWMGVYNESPETGLPWRPSDLVNGWQLDIIFHIVSSSWNSCYIGDIWAVLVPVVGPDLATGGSQILRPNGDMETTNWQNIGGSPTYNDAINDTVVDNDTTYITTSVDYSLISFRMDDPDSKFDVDHTFSCSAWIVTKSSDTYSSDRTFVIELWSGSTNSVLREIVSHNLWSNHSYAMPSVKYVGGETWTFDELVDIEFHIYSVSNLSITQAALIITDLQYIPTPPGGGAEPHGWVISEWVSGHGILTILAVLGFFGMIATPTITYLQYKNGEEGLLAGAHGMYLMMLFFGLFLIGLIAGG